jgi:hypothetical protein
VLKVLEVFRQCHYDRLHSRFQMKLYTHFQD